MWVGSVRSTPCTSANEELVTLAENNPLTGYEPNVIDNYHISATTEIFIQESSSDSRPSNLHDLEIDDYNIGKALEKIQRAVEEPITLKTKVGRPVSRRLSVIQQGDLLKLSLIHKFQTSEKFRATAQRVSKSGFWNDKKEQILADYRAEIQNHEFQADYDRRSIQKLNEMIESQREEICRAHQGDERLRRDQQLLHEQ